MKSIKLMRLELENFKCHDHLDLALNGKDASIYGDNATGKTSIYDALTWLLFGTDSAGNGEKSIDIKPLNSDGEVRDHRAITSVSAEFNVDGQPVRLQRQYREVWSTRRGSAEQVFTGNISDYFVDGVPCKKNLFDSKIKEIIQEDIFRMLTSVTYFAWDIPWKARRSILFDMAGTLTDEEIMEKKAEFKPLLEGIGSRSLDEMKAALTYQKKGLIGTRDEIPARISECEKSLSAIDSINVEENKEKENELQKLIEDLTAKIATIDSKSTVEDKRLELRATKLDRDSLERENQAFRKSNDGAMKRRELEGQLGLEKSRLETINGYITHNQAAMQRANDELNQLRQEWVQVNGEAFVGGMCPTCGQALPFEQLQKKTSDFESQKKKHLHDIELKAGMKQKAINDYAEEVAAYEDHKKAEENTIAELEAQLAALPSGASDVKDMDGYAEQMAAYDEKIKALQKEIVDLTVGADDEKAPLMEERRNASDQLHAVQAALGQASMAYQIRERITRLKQMAKDASDQLERIEQMLFLIEEFVRFKAHFVEESINDMFRIATFRLFREQANGGMEERCDVVYDGVPYMGLNSGMRINIGIDIINSLSRYYGVSVPLFIDNAESVTRIENCDTQVIRLVVSENDKELRITNEN